MQQSFLHCFSNNEIFFDYLLHRIKQCTFCFRANHLRPLICREPEGIWNLLEIVRDLLKTSDSNSTEILQIITEEFLNFHQLAFWWFISATEESTDGINERSLSFNAQNHSNASLSTTEFAKNAGARLLDECVTLWRVSLMKPELSDDERKQVKEKLEVWQKIVIEKARKGLMFFIDVIYSIDRKLISFCIL